MTESRRIGGLKAAETVKQRRGADYYSRIGKIGGSRSHPKTRTFSANPDLARRAGKIGGLKSSRGAKAA